MNLKLKYTLLFLVNIFILQLPLATAQRNVINCIQGDTATLLNGPAKGIFMMVNLPYTVDSADKIAETLSQNKCINGIFIRINWDEVEKSDGIFDWEQIDWAINIAHKNKLQYKIMLLPGEKTPNWVYEKGAEAFKTTFPWPMRKEYGTKTQIPIPWDPVFLNYFKRLLIMFSNRYQHDKNFVAITLTGVNFNYGEMHLPKTKEDISQWETYGNYSEKIEDVYNELIDFYSNTFPNQQLVLHISLPIPGMERSVENIIKYGIRIAPQQFTLQNAQLTGHGNNMNMFSYQLIYKYKDSVHVGFQSLNSFISAKERVGSVEVAIYNFINANAEFWEIFINDAMDELFACSLTKMIDNASLVGSQVYLTELEQKGKFTKDLGKKRQKIYYYRKKGNYEMALKVLNETFRFIYTDIQEKVDLLQKAGEPQSAIEFLKDIISQRNTAAFHEMLAEVFQNNGNIREAVNSLIMAFELSENSNYLLKGGILLADNKMKSEAIGLFNQYLNLEKQNKDSLKHILNLYSKYGYEQEFEKLREK